MKETVIRAIEKRFTSFAELAADIVEDIFSQQLPVAKNKSLQEHFWCLVGARESYTNAIAQGEWAGFACSLNTLNQSYIQQALKHSAEQFSQTIQAIPDWSPKQEELLVSLLEHEVMHEGQMIRLMYGLGYDLPASWKWA